MPRTARAAAGGYCYHVLNRGNRRAEVFHKDEDYAAVAALIRQTGAQGPVPLPADWLTYVNAPQTEAELERIRRSVMRGCPYGGADWVQRAAAELGLQSTLRPRGRPRRPPSPAPMTDQAVLF